MARLTKSELLQVVVRSVRQAGWRVLYVSDQYPFRFQIYHEDQSYRVRVYIWNLTHGGGPARPTYEYRIQITPINQFEPEIGGKTLILGWWQEAEVFAGFD